MPSTSALQGELHKQCLFALFDVLTLILISVWRQKVQWATVHTKLTWLPLPELFHFNILFVALLLKTEICASICCFQLRQTLGSHDFCRQSLTCLSDLGLFAPTVSESIFAMEASIINILISLHLRPVLLFLGKAKCEKFRPNMSTNRIIPTQGFY